MMKDEVVPSNLSVYYRLIALWVCCEALLGGIIHGLKLPISGLIVGSGAVICICLIAFYIPARGSILKATIIVAIFKMMLSPHSPLPAYFAVFFQGFVGELLFFNRKLYKAAAVLLAVLALMESALQRILVMTIVYGNDLWTAINDFISGFTKQSLNYSYWFVGFYLIFHFIAGVIVGIFVANLPLRLRAWHLQHQNIVVSGSDVVFSDGPKLKKKTKYFLWIAWMILLLLFIQSSLSIGKPLLPEHAALQILIRSFLILLTWYFLISPVLTGFLKKWLAKKQNDSQSDIQEIIRLLPSTKFIVIKSWQLSSSEKGMKRLLQFCKLVLTNTLRHA